MLGAASLLLAASSAPSQGASAERMVPAPWPNAFSVDFVTNVSTNSSDRAFAINNVMHYDWGLRMQAVEHGAGAIECAHFYNTSGACTLVFTLLRALA